MRFFAAAAAAALLVGLSPSLNAQAPTPSANDQEAAKAHYMAGSAYYDQANYGDAVKEFNEAYRLSGRADLLYNIAVSYERTGEFDNAIDALRRYLAAKPNAPDKNIIETRIGNLEKRRDAPKVAPSASPSPSPSPSPEPEVAAPKPHHRHVVSLVVGGIGVAALVAALGTGIQAQLLHDDLDKRCPNRVCAPSDKPDVDLGQTLAITTDVLIGVGAAAVVVGVVLFIVEARRPARASARLAPSGRDGGFAVHF